MLTNESIQLNDKIIPANPLFRVRREFVVDLVVRLDSRKILRWREPVFLDRREEVYQLLILCELQNIVQGQEIRDLRWGKGLPSSNLFVLLTRL